MRILAIPRFSAAHPPDSVEHGVLVLFSFVLGVLLTYYIGGPPLGIQLFAALAVWTAWQDARGRIVRDSFFAAFFLLAAFFASRSSPEDFIIAFCVTGSLGILIDCTNTNIRRGPICCGGTHQEKRVQVYSPIGVLLWYLLGVSVFLAIYMLHPAGLPRMDLLLVEHPRLVAACLIASLGAMVLLLRRMKKHPLPDLHTIEEHKVKPHSAWYFASFGALLGLGCSIILMVFLAFFCHMAWRGSQEGQRVSYVRFPFLPHKKKEGVAT